MRRNMRRRQKPRILPFLFVLACFVLLAVFLFRGTIKNALVLGASQLSQKTLVKPYVDTSFSTTLKEQLNQNQFSIASIRPVSGSSAVLVQLANGPQVIFSRNKDINWQVTALQSILARLTIENKTPQKIDFSFDKPIVNF